MNIIVDGFKVIKKDDGLYMPKFYNYESDKINFTYNDNDFDLLLE